MFLKKIRNLKFSTHDVINEQSPRPTSPYDEKEALCMTYYELLLCVPEDEQIFITE